MNIECLIQDNSKRFREIEVMPFGKERRAQLLLWLQTQTREMSWHIPYGFMVNRKHQLIVNKDPDLHYMIKKGVLIQINKLSTSRTSYNYLVLADKYNKNGTPK
ncbi:MAG: hypothetical protein ACRC6V_06890 [Bacteroidales bacterium]